MTEHTAMHGGRSISTWCSFCGSRVEWSHVEGNLFEGKCREQGHRSTLAVLAETIEITEVNL